MSAHLINQTTRTTLTVSGHPGQTLSEPPTRPRVLVVDSDQTRLDAIHTLLGPLFDVQCESNPFRALVALEEEGPFAAIVADLQTPGLDGIDLLETAYDQEPDTARILLAGEVTTSTSLDAINRAHVTNLLPTPVSEADLLHTVRSAALSCIDLTEEQGRPRIDLTSDI